MASIKKKLTKLTQIGLASIGLAGGWKLAEPMIDRAVAPARDYLSMKMDIPDVKGQIDEKMTQEDRERLEQLLDIMAKTPHGRHLLRSLGRKGTILSVVDSFEDRNTTLGATYETTDVHIKRDTLHGSGGLWTLAHELGHVWNNAHLCKALNAKSISDIHAETLDDAHMLEVINEALAERAAFFVCKEAKQRDPSCMTDQEYDDLLKDRGYGFLKSQGNMMTRAGGDTVFKARMTTIWHRSYEKGSKNKYDHFYDLLFEKSDNPWINEFRESWLEQGVFLGENPNWNKIVKMMSGAEVSSIPVFPVPTWDFVKELILTEAKQGRTVSQMDLTCVEKSKGWLLRSNVDFNAQILHNVYTVFKRLYALDKEKTLTWAKDLSDVVMPKEIVDFLCSEKFNTSCKPDDFPDVSLDDFLDQKGLDYLKKAQQALTSPKLDWSKDDEKLKEQTLILSAYQHIFFKKDARSIIKNNPKALQNVHL